MVKEQSRFKTAQVCKHVHVYWNDLVYNSLLLSVSELFWVF